MVLTPGLGERRAGTDRRAKAGALGVGDLGEGVTSALGVPAVDSGDQTRADLNFRRPAGGGGSGAGAAVTRGRLGTLARAAGRVLAYIRGPGAASSHLPKAWGVGVLVRGLCMR